MEEALKEWTIIFDDASYNIWQNSPPKFGIVQVMFYNLMKQLQALQNVFNEKYSEQIGIQASTSITENTTPIKRCKNLKNTLIEDLKNLEVKTEDNADISDVCSPNDTILSSIDINTSDSIFNRNVLDIDSPIPERGQSVVFEITSPTINRRKSNKKNKLAYPELNVTEKNMMQESISSPSSQICLINYKNAELSDRKLIQNDKSAQNLANTSSDLKSQENNKSFYSLNLSKIRKRIHNLRECSPKSAQEEHKSIKEEEIEAVLNTDDKNKSIDTTILFTCPQPAKEPSVLNKETLLKRRSVNATKPIFLSKWQQRKLQEDDLDEQNCPRCGNFRGFEDLSPTMCGTDGYKCPKHRKKYMRLNTPAAIWNLGFPEDSE